MSAQEPGIPQPTAAPSASAWAPLRHRTFRMLWLVWATANVCMWMNDVAAAWLMTTLTTSATLVAMVQTASSLPVFLLGFPSGALADLVDRRRLFLLTQVWVAANAAVLYTASLFDALNANLLLVLVFVNGIGLAIRWPVYAAILPELVSRAELGSALALNGVAVNMSRVVGPLLAGVIIASAGTGYVFALNFVLSLACAAVLFLWKRPEKPPSVLPGERFLGAMRLGWQYVRESRRMSDALVLTAVYFMHATALMALTPLVAQRLGGGAGTYTLLLASLGLGAVVAATQIPRLRARWNRDQVALGGSIVMALAIAGVALVPSVWVAAPAMFVGGTAWITVANSLTISAQLALPDWVRARGMAIYQMAIMGGSAGGALLWGRLAESTSVPWSLAPPPRRREPARLAAAHPRARPRGRGGGRPHADAPVHGAGPGDSAGGRRRPGDGDARVPDRSGALAGVRVDDGREPQRAAAPGCGLVGPLRGRAGAGPLHRVLRLRQLGRLPAALRPLHRHGPAPAVHALRLPSGRRAAADLALHRPPPAGALIRRKIIHHEDHEDHEEIVCWFRDRAGSIAT
jgi:MFS family permease